MQNQNLSAGSSGSEVANLHKALARNGISAPTAEISSQTFGPGTTRAVQQFQKKQGLPVTGIVDAATAAALAGDVAVGGVAGAGRAASGGAAGGVVAGGGVAGGRAEGGVVAGGGAPSGSTVVEGEAGGGAPGEGGSSAALYSVGGSVYLDTGLPASGLTLRAYGRRFGGADAKLGETKTDARGAYSISYNPGGIPLNLEIRVVDGQGKETALSNVKYNAGAHETLNLVAPSSLQPLASEYERLAADMDRFAGGIAKIGQAKESGDRQDLTLLNRSTNWDARLIALAATASQQVSTTGLGQDILYALYRVGLPTDPQHLAMVPPDTVRKALTKANQAGVIGLNDQQIGAATRSFQNFAIKTQLTLVTPGAPSKFGDLLAVNLSGNQLAAFASLYFSNPSAGADLWTQAAKIQIPTASLDLLKLQGKFLYLTFNNAALAQKLQQDIGSLRSLSQLADKNYHQGATWKAALTALAGNGGDAALQNLIPAIYAGKTADRLEAYSADLARKVRFSFPTQVTARMIDNKELAVDGASASKVSGFLRAAAPLGYKLGRTPLNSFLKNSGLPAMDAASTESLKTLHRLYQVTPSPESFQAAMKLGFKSANVIASHSYDDFMSKYSGDFPSSREAELVYAKSQQVSSVTFNFIQMAQQLDTSPPVYALSASSDDRRNAKNALVKQFPTIASLFGSLDFCECQDCRSVLSPAAYFVDLLHFLDNSPTNPFSPVTYTDPSTGTPKNLTPLDVLIGNRDAKVAGRRPDLPALPLSCENTNTAMPYIDLVNEIFEYYIANKRLDAGAAYDTGNATTADLTAEPQHILPSVYSNDIKNALYPRILPFDLWIETVRGFFNYFRNSLAQALDTLRPEDTLELFADGNSYPFYRAQILAESLGISPAEYDVLTITDSASRQPSTQNWFQLYGCADEPTALTELKSAKTLAQRLGLSYQELTDLLTTGFLNPGLNTLTFQFERFGISLDDAFSYAGQPNYPVLGPQAKANFEALLAAITARYKQQHPGFDAKTWLVTVLQTNYAQKVLVLHDTDPGCNFSTTTLQYADGKTGATAMDFLKFNLFVRLWKKLGWSLDETDRALQLFFPSNLPAWTDANFANAFTAAWKTALVYLAHLDDLNTRLAPALGRVALLPLWADLPVQGAAPLYAHLFLTPSVLNNDFSFDDPAGKFPSPASDLPTSLKPFTAHQAAVQGVLGLTSDEIAAILADVGVTLASADFSLANLSTCYRYSLLAKCLHVSVADLIALRAMSGLNPFQAVGAAPLSVLADDILYNQTLQFVKQAAAVKASGFTVEDLKYLLRHQFDPVGKYRTDPNALLALVQALASGLRLIQSQNVVAPGLSGLPEDVIESQLAGLFPAQILKSLFAVLTNSQTYQASQSGVLPANKIDPAAFAQETQLSLNYDSVTQVQSLTYHGSLLDWKKRDLLQINNSSLFSSLLDGVQKQAQDSFTQSVADVLSVWASLAEYDAVKTGVAAGLAAVPLTRKDPAISLSYDQADQLQRLAYRGVLTDVKKVALTGVNNSPDLLSLLNNVQQQAMPAYQEMVSALLGMWTNTQIYSATETAVAPANHVDPAAFFAVLAAAQQAGTITGPIPELHFSYDSSTQVQKVTCGGVPTAALRAQLAGLIPASSVVLANLLQTVRTEALQLFQTMATKILTVTPADLDTFSLPFLGTDEARKQKQLKAELVKVFMPLQARKLSRQLVLSTLSSNLGSDASLTETLVTDAGLVTDPNNLGKALLGSFLAVGQQGVSASYFASADGSGPSLATGTAASPDTNDPSNPSAGKAGAGSAHFEGYLQVPTDGPYRFFAELGNIDATVQLQIDSPNPSALLKNPILSSSIPATKDHDEISQFVQLRGGVSYHFTADFGNLGAGGASLLVQSENLPKGPLSQLILYPQVAVAAFARANVLLSKVLRILQRTGLDERELGYLTANAAQFNNLKLSSLPTQAGDDSPLRATTLFSQFLTLADYGDLRRGPAGGLDTLVDVFENVGQTFTEAVASQDSNKDPRTPWTRLANLTRRDPQAVRDVAKYLKLVQETISPTGRRVTAVGDFGNNKGLRRIWQVLQLAQIVGIPIASLTASTVIASLSPPAGSPAADAIAANLKNAVKAQYTPDVWRPIAKSIFDPLRRKKRDALVAHLIHTLPAEDASQLFEYFLVDPGMEPVVQTSRLRLALSSLQTFVQRCLLNLENGNIAQPSLNILPSSIKADWWGWMKRYRVWEANREIFLFPENWMIPELRSDKTDLFQAMESALLQGDVTRGLVEDAFLAYLKGLDLRARLDIVAMYLDQDPAQLNLSTLYVLGRTYGQPHKYFYRTYSNGSWSGWEAVTQDIEGDHVLLVIWRGRLNIFWATFITQAQPPSQGSSSPSGAASGLSFDQLEGAIFGLAAQPQVKVQLHWCEYFKGKWTSRISTDVSHYGTIGVPQGFDPRNVLIHASKEVDSNGDEGAVRIHLDFAYPDGGVSFRVTSKNCDPGFDEQYWESAPEMVYDAYDVNATLYTGRGNLTSIFRSDISSLGTTTSNPENILDTLNDFALLTCSNPVAPPFLNQTEPFYWEAGALICPFFFKDTTNPNADSQSTFFDELTFFVQPSLTEQTIDEWEGWAIAPSTPAQDWADPGVLDQVSVIAQVPAAGRVPIGPGDPAYSIYSLQSRMDWATHPATAISYGNTWIGQGGGVQMSGLAAAKGGVGISHGALGNAVRPSVTARTAAGIFVLVSGQGVRANQLHAIKAISTPVAVDEGAQLRGGNFSRGRNP